MGLLVAIILIYAAYKLLGGFAKFVIPAITIIYAITLAVKYWWLIAVVAIGTAVWYGYDKKMSNKPNVSKPEVHKTQDANFEEVHQPDVNSSSQEPTEDQVITDNNLSKIEVPKSNNTETENTVSIPVRERVVPTVHKLRRKLTDFVVFDIETTGLNRYENELTQVSAVKYRNDKLVEKFNTYVNPHQMLDKNITFLTGITNEMVTNAPETETVIQQFTDFIEDLPLVGHNIYRFDIPFLIAKGFSVQDIYALDTYPLSNNKLPKLKNHKLPTLKEYYGIVNGSHNSLNDCETNAIVYQNLRDDRLDQVEPDYSKFEKTLVGLRFSITGQFIEKGRDEIAEEIIEHGGKYTKTVTKLTNYLIDGTQIATNLVDGKHSSSELKAMTSDVTKIISLDDFEKMALNKSKQETA